MPKISYIIAKNVFLVNLLSNKQNFDEINVMSILEERETLIKDFDELFYCQLLNRSPEIKHFHRKESFEYFLKFKIQLKNEAEEIKFKIFLTYMKEMKLNVNFYDEEKYMLDGLI